MQQSYTSLDLAFAKIGQNLWEVFQTPGLNLRRYCPTGDQIKTFHQILPLRSVTEDETQSLAYPSLHVDSVLMVQCADKQ